MKQWRKNHPDAATKYTEKLKRSILVHYGDNPPQCACCGETEIKFLTIDHINNDGAKHRKIFRLNRGGKSLYCWIKRNGFPEGFQVLCYNCNCGRYRNKGICPHKEK